MRVEIDVPDYYPERGLHMAWEDGFVISVEVANDTVLLSANQPGLVSLARLLLTLADEQVPVGSHWHLDAPANDHLYELEKGSWDTIIQKI